MASTTVPENKCEEPTSLEPARTVTDLGFEVERAEQERGGETDGEETVGEKRVQTAGEERGEEADKEERGGETDGEERIQTDGEERGGEEEEDKRERGDETDGEQRVREINEDLRAQGADEEESIPLPLTSTQTDAHTETNITETLTRLRLEHRTIESKIASLKDRLKWFKKRLRNLARLLKEVKVHIQASRQRNMSSLSTQTCPVQETNPGTQISMIHQPTTPVERYIHNNFRLLVHVIQHLANPDTLRQLKRWASERFGIPVNEHSRVWDVFCMLDAAGLINASNLMLPRQFFARICRFEIVHIIDEFELRNYDILRSVNITRWPVAPNNQPVELRFSLPGKRIFNSLLAQSIFKIATIYYIKCIVFS